jgi:hypothetical protein
MTRWIARSAVPVLAAGSLLGPSAGAHATASSCGPGALVNSNSPNTFDELRGIAAVSPHDVWAVGSYIKENRHFALIEHGDGRGFRAVPVPQPVAHTVVLLGVAAVSATDVWAVGFSENRHDENQQTLIEHWDGSAWRIVPSPSPGGLFAVAAGSASDVWAVGDIPSTINTKARTLAEHWDGTRWRVVPAPSPGQFGDSFSGVSVIGPDDVWAVGDAVTSQFETFAAFTEHWNGTAWSAVPAPRPGIGSELRAVTSAGSNDVWAAGEFDVQTPTGTASFTLTERWNGTAWSEVASPGPTGDDLFNGVAAVSADDIWAVGSQAGRSDLVAQWNGKAWAIVPSPRRAHALNLLWAVSAPSATDIWADGLDINLRDFSDHTLVEAVCGT